MAEDRENWSDNSKNDETNPDENDVEAHSWNDRGNWGESGDRANLGENGERANLGENGERAKLT